MEYIRLKFQALFPNADKTHKNKKEYGLRTLCTYMQAYIKILNGFQILISSTYLTMKILKK